MKSSQSRRRIVYNMKKNSGKKTHHVTLNHSPSRVQQQGKLIVVKPSHIAMAPKKRWLMQWYEYQKIMEKINKKLHMGLKQFHDIQDGKQLEKRNGKKTNILPSV